MAWYFDRGYDSRRFKRELTELGRRRPDAAAIRGKLCGATAEHIDLLAMADIADDEGFAVLARVIRTGMYIQQRGKTTRIYATGNRRPKRRRVKR